MVADIEELGKFQTRQKSTFEDSMLQKYDCFKSVEISCSQLQMEQQKCVEEIMKSTMCTKAGSMSEDLRKEIQGNSVRSQTTEIKDGDGTAVLLGRDLEIRQSTLRQYQLLGSEEFKEEIQGNSDELQPADTKEDAEVRSEFWSIEGDFIYFMYRYHDELRVHISMCRSA